MLTLTTSMNGFKLNGYIIQRIDAELIVKEYGINVFSFLTSFFHNSPEKGVMGFFCS